jgi:hypothetical protein
MPERKERWLLGNGLVTGLILLMATPVFAGPLMMDEAGPCVCVFMIIVGMILILQVIPAGILFLCLLGAILVILYKMYRNRNTIA